MVPPGPAFTAGSQPLAMTVTDGWRRMVTMAEHTTRRIRSKSVAMALVALLVGGTAGIDAVASQLSREIRAGQVSPVPAAPNTGHGAVPASS